MEADAVVGGDPREARLDELAVARAAMLLAVVVRARATRQEAEAVHRPELRAERVGDAVLEPADHPGTRAPEDEPCSHASRSSTSMPCTRQIASMFAVLPPLTQIASCERISSRRPAGGHGKRLQVRQLAAPREHLVEADDAAVRLRNRSRHVEETWELLAGQPEHVVVEPVRLLSGVASPAQTDDVPHIAHGPSLRHRFWLNRGMASSSKLEVGDRSYEIFRIDGYDVAKLPYTLRVLLENVLRQGSEHDAEAVAGWDATAEPSQEISFAPSRVLLQDLTGVPAVVDLAAMRNAMADLGGEPSKINPLIPAELVIDHSVQVDAFASRVAFGRNVELEFERNHERYLFLRWGQESFRDFKVVPPGTGICHQVNLEYLARVVEDRDGFAFPDTLVGTDSHTTMVNGLGVLGWGAGGIEAEAAMLGQPLSMLVPQVVGFKLSGTLPDGSTATDLVLTVTEMLRKTGVVGKFVEYYGEGLAGLSLADRATIGNMSPEYGATCGFFPVDQVTLDYLRLTGRSDERIALVEAYCKENLLWHDPSAHATYSEVVELDLGDVEPSLAGPRRPQDRVPLAHAKTRSSRRSARSASTTRTARTTSAVADTFPASDPTTEQQPAGSPEPVADLAPATGAAPRIPTPVAGTDFELDHGSVVIAAITSCTNTSNPQVMVAAGLLARNAIARGLPRKPWVKSSLAPGSKVVTRYYEQAGLQQHLDALGFNTVGYGCTTCIGNSGPLADEISGAITEGDLVVCSVLSGNRNFEARIHPEVKANYLASPPLVVAYSLAGRMDIDFEHEPIGTGRRATTSSSGTSGRAPPRSARRSPRRCVRSSSPRRTPTCSPATRPGARCRCLRVSCSRGSRTRRTCGSRRTSRA